MARRYAGARRHGRSAAPRRRRRSSGAGEAPWLPTIRRVLAASIRVTSKVVENGAAEAHHRCHALACHDAIGRARPRATDDIRPHSRALGLTAICLGFLMITLDATIV